MNQKVTQVTRGTLKKRKKVREQEEKKSKGRKRLRIEHRNTRVSEKETRPHEQD